MLKFAFVHVPRTAGTSFRLQMQKAGMRVFMDYGDDPFTQGRHGHFDSIDAVMKSGEFDVVAGHVAASRYAGAASANGWKLVTWIRDPFERLRSNYAHWIQQFWLGKMSGETHVAFCKERPSFLDWVSRPEVAGSLGLQLDIPPQDFDFIGQTESYQNDLERFNRHFGTSFQVSRENADFLGLKLTAEQIEDGVAHIELKKDYKLYCNFVDEVLRDLRNKPEA